jgi:hypothetical protein
LTKTIRCEMAKCPICKKPLKEDRVQTKYGAFYAHAKCVRKIEQLRKEAVVVRIRRSSDNGG